MSSLLFCPFSFSFILPRPPTSTLFPYTTLFRSIQTGAERMPHDLSHLGFLAGQIGRLITISTTPVIAGDQSDQQGDRKSGSAGMPRPISYAVFCLKKKKDVTPSPGSSCPMRGR